MTKKETIGTMILAIVMLSIAIFGVTIGLKSIGVLERSKVKFKKLSLSNNSV